MKHQWSKRVLEEGAKDSGVTTGAREEAVRLIEGWLADDSGYDEETWPELKAALERDRSSRRKLFVD